MAVIGCEHQSGIAFRIFAIQITFLLRQPGQLQHVAGTGRLMNIIICRKRRLIIIPTSHTRVPFLRDPFAGHRGSIDPNLIEQKYEYSMI